MDMSTLEKILKDLQLDSSVSKNQLMKIINDTEDLDILPPPFYMIDFKCPAACSYIDYRLIREAENCISELLYMNHHPVNIIDSIERLPYRRSVKDKLASLLSSGDDGLHKIIAELIQLNMNNFQPRTKELIEKLILLFNITNLNINQTNKDSPEFLNTVIYLQRISSFDFNDYYKPFININHFNVFIENIKKGMGNESREFPFTSMDIEKWDYNENFFRKLIKIGSSYNNINAGINNDASSSLKINSEFEDVFIPRKTASIKYFSNIIVNYFNASPWRKRASFILKYYVLHHSMCLLRFESCKDSSLSLRFVAGSDCSEGLNSQLADPASSFYKIYMNNEWIGYVSLLSVKTVKDDKAILIDVINIKQSMESFNLIINDFFDNFIDTFIEESGVDGYRYILITTNNKLLSNRNGETIYNKYER